MKGREFGIKRSGDQQKDDEPTGVQIDGYPIDPPDLDAFPMHAVLLP
jgi:hypothetical protein